MSLMAATITSDTEEVARELRITFFLLSKIRSGSIWDFGDTPIWHLRSDRVYINPKLPHTSFDSIVAA